MKLPWSRDARSDADDSGEAALRIPQAFYLGAVRSILALLREALVALRSGPEQQEVDIVDELQSQFTAEQLADESQATRLEKRLGKDTQRLRSYIKRQREAGHSRERELSDVVKLLSRSVAEATRENASFYRDIRAEGERIAEASRLDDLSRLKSVVQVAAQKLDTLVQSKESYDQSRIEALSGQIESLKVELQEARATAQTDPLTGVLNRRSFDDAIAALVQRHSDTRRGFALIMFDIDNFKRINDQYGHPVGDRVLLAFTQRCSSLLRPEDRLARYGGEEFAVLLDEVSLRHAMKRAAGICEAVAGARYAIDKGENSRQIAMTVSAGVAALRRREAAADLIDRADRALYLAKRRGKNQAVSEKALED